MQRSGNSKECAGTARERLDNARERQNRAPGRARTPQKAIGSKRTHKDGEGLRVLSIILYEPRESEFRRVRACLLRPPLAGGLRRWLEPVWGSSLIARPAPRTTVSVL